MIHNSKHLSTILILILTNDFKSVAWIAPQDRERMSNAFVLLQASYRDQDMLGMSADVPDLNLFSQT